MNAANNNQKTLTQHEEFLKIQQNHWRFIEKGDKPEPGEMDILSVKHVWDIYCDYNIARVSAALHKAELALEYMKAIAAHPAYSFSAYTQLGNPILMANEYAEKQIEFATAELGSRKFFNIRKEEQQEEDVLDAVHKLQNLGEVFNSAAHNTFVSALNLGNDKVAVKPPKIAVIRANKKINDIVERYYEASNGQVENHLAYMDMMVTLYAQDMAIKSPYLEDNLNLSQKFFKTDLLLMMKNTETQMNENQWAEKARGQHAEDGKAMFPLIRPQPLDFN